MVSHTQGLCSGCFVSKKLLGRIHPRILLVWFQDLLRAGDLFEGGSGLSLKLWLSSGLQLLVLVRRALTHVSCRPHQG